jgi:hypothetical protein
MKAKISDFTQQGDGFLDRIDYPLFRAMAAGVKELEMSPESFLMAMRYAVQNNVYHHVLSESGDYPMILNMKITIV